MKQVQKYIEMAQQAGEHKEHVAVAMNYRTAAELASSPEELIGIMQAAIDYAANLKKPMDRRAMYEWGQEVTAKRLPENPLENKIGELIAEVVREGD